MFGEEGDAYVVRAGKEFAIAARNTMNEVTMATPAIVGDRLLVRTRTEVVALGSRQAVP